MLLKIVEFLLNILKAVLACTGLSTKEVEVAGSLEPRSSRPAWATKGPWLKKQGKKRKKETKIL
jgi:hypothetical protein